MPALSCQTSDRLHSSSAALHIQIWETIWIVIRIFSNLPYHSLWGLIFKNVWLWPFFLCVEIYFKSSEKVMDEKATILMDKTNLGRRDEQLSFEWMLIRMSLRGYWQLSLIHVTYLLPVVWINIFEKLYPNVETLSFLMKDLREYIFFFTILCKFCSFFSQKIRSYRVLSDWEDLFVEHWPGTSLLQQMLNGWIVFCSKIFY